MRYLQDRWNLFNHQSILRVNYTNHSNSRRELYPQGKQVNYVIKITGKYNYNLQGALGYLQVLELSFLSLPGLVLGK